MTILDLALTKDGLRVVFGREVGFSAGGSPGGYRRWADSRPVTFPEVFATLYRNLGIDVNTATVTDNNSRSHDLVEGGAQPIRELI